MPSNNEKKSNSGFIGTKIFIGAVSLAGTFGLWNLFAAKPVEEVKTPAVPTKDYQQTSDAVVLEFPPLPTLVPIRIPTGGQELVLNTTNETPSVLRQVGQPTPLPTQSIKPVFEQIIINQPGSSSPSSGAGSSGSSR